MSRVSWLAFDAGQQRATELMMQALAAQDTIDQLGMGLIRDLVARMLHPDLTVQYERARYLVLIPRIYRSLSGTSVEELLEKGRKQERALRDALVEYYDDGAEGDRRGIVGLRSERLASGVYWSLIRSLGIEQSGSVAGFCRTRVEAVKARNAKDFLHGEEDYEVVAEHEQVELPADPGESRGFNLSFDEADWLRSLFVKPRRDDKRPRHKEERSLMAWMLEQDTWYEDLGRPWYHPERDQFPSATAEAMWVGHDADALVHGARILYNLLCTLGSPESDRRAELVDEYTTELAAWHRDSSGAPWLRSSRLDEIDAWARSRMAQIQASALTERRWDLTLAFLRRWQKVVAVAGDLADSREAARLVVQREKDLKGDRALLTNRALLTDWPGRLGYGRLDFNWGVAHRLLTDIHHGLQTPFVKLVGAE